MNIRIGTLVCAVLWLLCGIAATGTLNAMYRGAFHDLHESPGHARQTLGISVLLGFGGGPFSLVIGGFIGGFWYHGWTLTTSPFPCDRDPAIWCK